MVKDKTEDSEKWLPIPDWPKYLISNQGRVLSLKTRKPRFLSRCLNGAGYYYVNLCKRLFPGYESKMIAVHELVLMAFVGLKPEPKDGMRYCAAHYNGDKIDNRVENLRWDTYYGNNMDKWRHGTMPHGVQICAAKLSEEDVRNIRKESGIQREIADRYGVSRPLVCLIKARKRWKHIK